MLRSVAHQPLLASPAGRQARGPGLRSRAPHAPARSRVKTATDVAAVTAPSEGSAEAVKPAVLPGTPASFPIPADKLISLAKHALSTDTGVTDESVLADNFRFEFPIVSLDRERYLKSVRGFGLRQGIPDLASNAYDWRVDTYEPNRVWFTIRTTGRHTGAFKFGRSTYEATGRVIQGAPECCSYVFNEDGKIETFTGGYVMDRRVGNTGGLGAAFGILTAIGAKIPQPGSFGWGLTLLINSILTWFDNLFKKKN